MPSLLAGLEQLAVAPAKLVRLLNATNMLALFAIAEAEAVLFCGVSDQRVRESKTDESRRRSITLILLTPFSCPILTVI